MSRLPLQVGRAALAQTTRYAATLWLGPVLLLVATAMHDVFTIVLAPASIVFMTVAFMAAEAAKSDRPSDAVLDAEHRHHAGDDVRDRTRVELAGAVELELDQRRTAAPWSARALYAETMRWTSLWRTTSSDPKWTNSMSGTPCRTPATSTRRQYRFPIQRGARRGRVNPGITGGASMLGIIPGWRISVARGVPRAS